MTQPPDQNEEPPDKKPPPSPEETAEFETLVQGGASENDPTMAPPDSLDHDSQTLVSGSDVRPPGDSMTPTVAPPPTVGGDTRVEPGEELTMAPRNPEGAETMPGGQDSRAETMPGGPGATVPSTRPPTHPTAGQPANLVSEAPVIDGYQITGKIGEGGMGVVWKALQLSTNRVCALKLLPPSSIGSGKAQQRFQREVETAAALEHPHICGVYDSGINRGVYFYAMQAVDGVEMQDYIAEHQLDLRGKLELMVKVCRALEYAHQHGVIHRDLKPGNILVTHEGEPSILDFGLAKSVDRDTNLSIAGEVVGTPMYMSTEQARGDVDNLDGRTDIYSLGVMLFDQCCGNFPYESTGGPYAIIQRKFDQLPFRPTQFNRDVNLDVEAVIMKAIAPDPAARHASSEELAQDLENFLNDRPVSARRHTFSYVSWLWLKRNGIKLAAVALLLALVSGGYAFQRWKANVDQKASEERILKESQAEKDRLQKERLAALAKAGSAKKDTAVEALQRSVSDSLASLEATLDDQDLVEAEIHLEQLNGITTGNTNVLSRAEIDGVIAPFRTRWDGLAARFKQMEEAEMARLSAMKAAAAEVRAMVAELEEIDPTRPGSLNEELLARLGALRAKYNEAVRAQPEVKTQLNRISGSIALIAEGVISDRSNLDGRKARLRPLGMFLKDPRLVALVPGLAPVAVRYDQEQALFILELANINAEPVFVTHGSRKETIPGGENVQLVFTEADGAKIELRLNIAKSENSAEADPRRETKKRMLAFVAGDGLFERITSFGAVKIPVRFPPMGDLEQGGMQIQYSQFPNDDYKPVPPEGLSLDERAWYVRFIRYDHETIQTNVIVKVGMPDVVIAPPPTGAWKPKPYLARVTALKKHLDAEELTEGLALVSQVKLEDIDSARVRESYAQIRARLMNHPLRKLQESLPAAEAKITDFVEAMVQRHDPLAKRWGPQFRFENKDAPVPLFTMPVLDAGELGRMSPAYQARYQLTLAWQQAAKGLEGLSKPAHAEGRAIAARSLQAYLSAHGALDAKTAALVRAQLAVLQRPDKGSDAPGALAQLDHPLLLKWYAHATYRAGDYEKGAEVLSAFARIHQLGGSMDRFDIRIANYAAHAAFANVVKSVRIEGMHAGHPAYVAEKERAEEIFRHFAATMRSFEQPEFLEVAAEFEADAGKDKTRLEQRIEIMNVLGQLPLDVASKAAASQCFTTLLERHRAIYKEVKNNSHVIKNYNALNGVIAEVVREYREQ